MLFSNKLNQLIFDLLFVWYQHKAGCMGITKSTRAYRLQGEEGV